jgi:hypothetical protein
MMAKAELDRRLTAWAAARRLSDAQLAGIRAHVTGVDATVLEPAPAFDAERLWSMLRPVTDLVELTANIGEISLPRRFPKWINQFIGTETYQPYLRLA